MPVTPWREEAPKCKCGEMMVRYDQGWACPLRHIHNTFAHSLTPDRVFAERAADLREAQLNECIETAEAWVHHRPATRAEEGMVEALRRIAKVGASREDEAGGSDEPS